MDDLQVRGAQHDDLIAMHAIRREAILGIDVGWEVEAGARQAWADRRSSEAFADRVAAGDAVIALLAGHEVGWGSSTGDRITGLYVRPSIGHSGVGRTLMAVLEAAVEARGHAHSYLQSSPNAVGFYTKLGYAPTGMAQSEAGLPMWRQLNLPK